MHKTIHHRMLLAAPLLVLCCIMCNDLDAKEKKKKQEKAENPYAAYVWPPPPDEAQIGLVNVVYGAADVEGRGKLARGLFGASPKGQFDELKKPMDVAFDAAGRLWVTDWGLGALIRFDLEGERMDVMGTKGQVQLQQPLGLDVGSDGVAYVADIGTRQVVAFDGEGEVVGVYGGGGDLQNPTDVAVLAGGKHIVVTDTGRHQLVVFELETGNRTAVFGRRGVGDGEFNYPSEVAVGPEGNLFVVDQMSARIQMLSDEGEFLDVLGARGIGMGQFVRPKGIAVDRFGLIYVTDAAFNNLQVFDFDFQLLTFIGEGGSDPGRFTQPSGVDVFKDTFAVVDQINKRVQIFKFVKPRGEE